MKGTLLSIILIIFLIIDVSAQNEFSIPDSILKRIESKKIDTNLIKDLKTVFNVFPSSNTIPFDLKIKMLDSAISLSNSINYIKGSAKLYNLKGVVAFREHKNEISKKSYLKALKLIESKELNDDYLDYYINLCNALLNKNDDSAYFYVNNLLKLSEEYQDSTIIGKSLATMARYYYIKEDISEYIKYLQDAGSYFDKDNYEFWAVHYINLGIAYFEIQDYQKSRESYMEALANGRKTEYDYYRSLVYNNLGRLYHVGFNKLDSAIFYFEKSLRIKDSLNDEYGKLSLFINIGNVYNEKGDLNNALKYYKYVENSDLIDKMPRELTANTINLGMIYTKKNNSELAKQYLKKGLEIAGNEMLRYKKVAYENLAEIAEREGNAKLVSVYKDSIFDLQSRVWDNDLQERIADINAKNNLGNVKNKNLLLKKEQEAKNKKLFYKNVLIAITISSVIFLTSMLIVLFKNRKKIDKLNISLQNNLEELEEKNKTLEKLNNTKDKFFSIIAHDLQGPIGSTSKLLEQLELNYDKLNKETQLSIISSLKESGMETFDLLENLLDWAKTQKSEFEYNPVKIELINTVKTAFKLLDIRAKSKDQKLWLNSDKEIINLVSDKKMLMAIIINILNNSIKFSGRNTVITVTLKDKDDVVDILFSDQGIGIPAEFQKSLFELGDNISRPGTEKESGTGLGLILSKEFADLMNAELMLLKSDNSGTDFLLRLRKNL